MKLKTVTRNIAFALLAVTMTGVVISSCSTDEYDDCGLTMAKRKVQQAESQHVEIKKPGSHSFVFLGKLTSVTYKVSWEAGELYLNTNPDAENPEVALLDKDNHELSVRYYKNMLYNSPKWGSCIDGKTILLSMLAKDVVEIRDQNNSIVYDTVNMEAITQFKDIDVNVEWY